MPLSPLFQFSRHRRTSAFVVPGSSPMNVYGKLLSSLVVLRRKVVRLGLAAAADPLGVLVALVHVMRNRPHVVEELAEQVPAAFALHHRRSEQQIAGGFDRVFQLEARRRLEPDVAEALVGRRARAVVGVRRGRKPSLVDAAAMTAERIEIVGVQLQPAAGNHERAGNPARIQPQDARSGVDRFLNAERFTMRWGPHQLEAGLFTVGDDTKLLQQRQGPAPRDRTFHSERYLPKAPYGRNCLRSHAVDARTCAPRNGSASPIAGCRCAMRNARLRGDTGWRFEVVSLPAFWPSGLSGLLTFLPVTLSKTAGDNRRWPTSPDRESNQDLTKQVTPSGHCGVCCSFPSRRSGQLSTRPLPSRPGGLRHSDCSAGCHNHECFQRFQPQVQPARPGRLDHRGRNSRRRQPFSRVRICQGG